MSAQTHSNTTVNYILYLSKSCISTALSSLLLHRSNRVVTQLLCVRPCLDDVQSAVKIHWKYKSILRAYSLGRFYVLSCNLCVVFTVCSERSCGPHGSRGQRWQRRHSVNGIVLWCHMFSHFRCSVLWRRVYVVTIRPLTNKRFNTSITHIFLRKIKLQNDRCHKYFTMNYLFWASF